MKESSSALIRLCPFAIALACFAGCSDTIHDYASKADIEHVAALVARDPNLVNSRNPLGKTPLHMAVTSGSTKMVGWLIEHGADVNAKDKTGLTPLHIAAWWTATERAAFLLDHGADINACDNFGDTPLHIAAVQGRKAMVNFLIERGANAAAKNNDGRTAAELARTHNQTDTAELIDSLRNAN